MINTITKDKDITNSKWYLGLIARERGYGTEPQTTLTDNKITIEIDWGKDEVKGE